MFHTYVTASSGNKVDIDRARYLMDDALFAAAERELIKLMTPNGFKPFDIHAANAVRPPGWKAEYVWARYCRLHEAKYGEPFEPDVDPAWDH